MESYAAAKAAAEEQSRRSDPFSSLWAELRQARAWFDSEGSIPDGASRQAESEAMVALLREGGGAQLQQALSSFASGLEG
jgi:hypothetical protein